MADRLIIEVVDAEAQARLAEAAARLEHPRELLERIGGVLERNVNLRLDTKKAPDGTAWLPLAKSTVRRYLKKYNGNIPGSLLEVAPRERGWSLAAMSGVFGSQGCPARAGMPLRVVSTPPDGMGLPCASEGEVLRWKLVGVGTSIFLRLG